MRLPAGLVLLAAAGVVAPASSAFGQDQPAVALPQSVRAVWDLARAAHEATPTRERFCLNGLWRWQPGKLEGGTLPAQNWGYFKVPGPWPGVEDWMQSDYQTLFAHPSWKGQDRGAFRAAWYQREIDAPAGWAGRRIALAVEYLNSYAAAYLDGRQVGELRFPGGELDLTAALRPGQQQVLSLFVVALPLKGVMMSYNDTNSAKQVPGFVARRGLCGDVWLSSTPAGPRLADVRVDTSVQRGEIRFEAGLQGLADGARYVLRAHLADHGAAVADFAGQPFTAADLKEGRGAFTAAWKPDKLWDIDTPQNQYDCTLTLAAAGGQALDTALPVRFGYRELWIVGRDFILNGTRLYLSALPLDNAQVGAALSTYDGAKESLLRLKSFGINFVYTHNYGCEPGDHLGFTEILRACDDVGMLVALSQPHFGAYDWQAADADRANGYAPLAEFFVRVAGSHPAVVAYSTSHNATGYNGDMDPDLIDGLRDVRDEWSKRNASFALRAEAIIKQIDPYRLVYHHSSGNLSAMHTSNFYPNWVPIQELDDWFEHWATVGAKPVFLVEYAAPAGWDWTMYRGWYNGQREFGSAPVPWEYCIAEWNAQLLGDRAYQTSERANADIRWEAQRFKQGATWHRWDYPTAVGDERMDDIHPVQAAYTTSNWRAFRTWGVSANSPWECARFWQLKEGFNPQRRDLPVDWDNLQRPGFSPDFIDRTYQRFDLAYQTTDWVASPEAEALFRNNRPLLGYIAGKPARFTSKDHLFTPGESVEKQLVVINNSRRTVTCDAAWSFALQPALAVSQQVVVKTGDQTRIPLKLDLPAGLAPGQYALSATFKFSSGETQADRFTVEVIPRPQPPRPAERIALFDPPGETAQLLAGLGVTCQQVEAGADLAGYDLLLVGKGALTVDGPAPDLRRVRDGLRVVVFEQTSAALEQRLGFRVNEYGLRQVFPRVPDHPLLAGLGAEELRDWRGAATLLPPRLDVELSQRYNGAPTVRWCGLEVTRLWRCGNQGEVASVLIEKPPRGDFYPIVDGGYALQYSPLMEYREGRGMVLFCQMDVTGRSEREPAAETLAGNILRYAAAWRPAPRRSAIYAGEPAGAAWLAACGIEATQYTGAPKADQVVVVGPGGGRELGPHKAALAGWLRGGGRLLALGLDQAEAAAILPAPPAMEEREHLGTVFPPFGTASPLAGVGPADVYNRDPRKLPLVTGGADAYGDGVLASGGGVVYCQLPPFAVTRSMGALGSVTVTGDEPAAGKQSALVTMGTLVYAQFGGKVKAGEPGREYTFAAAIKALGEPAVVRLEVERAGRPWDRAVRGDDTTVNPGQWTEVHLTFKVDKPYPEGWQAYVNGSAGQFRVDRVRLYEGAYVPGSDAEGRNLFPNAGFEDGLNGWYFTHGPDQFNLRRTFRRTSFALARILGNAGISGATPLLERFGEPVGKAAGPSVLKNGDFALDADGNGLGDEWEFGAGVQGAACTREQLPGSGWAQLMTIPAPAAGAKPPDVMIAQHEMPIQGGQWYRCSLRARAAGLTASAVTWTIQNTANWQSVFEYQRFSPPAEWQAFSYRVQAKETVLKGTKFQIWFSGSGQLWLADVRLEPIQDPTLGRWLDGLYLDRPTEWDDPYRFFRW